MKYIVIIGDGMADFPLDELGGKTPLMASRKPNMDMMAQNGIVGRVNTVPDGFPPGSDVAGMSLFGYDPARYYAGRASIEAFGMGIPMCADDVAYRCNLVHIGPGDDHGVMVDYSGGHVSTGEAKVIVEALNEKLGNDEIKFYTGVGYRHIMIWRGGKSNLTTTPPHDITGKAVAPYLPSGEGAEKVRELMDGSRELLASHEINKRRIDSGKAPVNSIWLWGQGTRTNLPPFKKKFGLKGATVCAVDLIRGLSRLAGFETPTIAGATGYLDTDYGAKARAALKLIKDYDIVYIHIEAPDEASHNGSIPDKIEAIERIDRDVLGFLLEKSGNDTRFLVVTDHATPISMRTHFAVPVPFAIFEKDKHFEGSGRNYDEKVDGATLTGEEMVRFFIGGQK
jgi:2,3-bisphosphoglycerate-independent phosphoglycerate mutase